ncbi:MAG: hypothetical protein IJ816_02720 [Alloprevotella sp.]|nr:hypothetical protein [Alloprevotella sp.]
MSLWIVQANSLKAQDDTVYRLELGLGAGCGFGINDLGSKLYGNTGAAAGLIARFPLNPRMAIKLSLNYLRVSGNNAGLDDFYPVLTAGSSAERMMYEASGSLFDLGGLYELHLLPYGWQKGYQGYKRFTPYLQLGFGLTYSAVGKAFTANFPVGLGVKWKIAERLNAGLSWTFHFTPNDKLEGLEAPHGIKSEGFRNKDHYNLTMLSLTYDLSPRCPSCNKDR